MKVLFILTYYYPYWTGLTQYAKRVAEGLSLKGFQVTVLTTKHANGLKDKEVLNGVKVIRKPVLFRLSRTLISLQIIISLWSEIKNNDQIIVFLPLAEVFLVALLCKLFGKNFLLVHNGDLVLSKGLTNRLIEKIYFITTELAIQFSNGIIIHTKDYALNSSSLSKFPNKWKVILPPFPPLKVDKKYLSKLKLKLGFGEKAIIGFSGRFVEEKGFDFLFRAIPLVIKKNPSVIFVFAGETNIPYENFFEKNKFLIEPYKKYCNFLGLIDQTKMAAFYQTLDLLVISSRTDCFPFVQVEALLCGVPVVVTDIPGARWPVKKTGMGIVVKPKDVKGLAEGILKAIKNKQKYKESRKEVIKLFDYEKSINDFITILRERT